MKILITGSEGNIGSMLVPHLRSMDHEVFRTDQRQEYYDDYRTANILSVPELESAFHLFDPEVVIHLAAMVSRVVCEKSPSMTVETNVMGTYNVAQLCKKYKAKMVSFSTSEVYGNIGGYLSEDRECHPNNIYGISKHIAEKLVEYESLNGLKAIIIRPFMLYHQDERYGGNHSAMIRFAYNLVKRGKITVHKDSKRSWLYMTDFVRMVEKILHKHDDFWNSKLYNIKINFGSDELITTEELAQMMCREIGIDYHKHAIIEDLPDHMTLEKYPDIRKQTSYTNYHPQVCLSDGIKRVIQNVINRT